jgi:hypothetical protein
MPNRLKALLKWKNHEKTKNTVASTLKRSNFDVSDSKQFDLLQINFNFQIKLI